MDDTSQRQAAEGAPLLLSLPRRTLLVLCGPAGCGKSTFATTLVANYAAPGLRPTSIVSSDFCRTLICDDEDRQTVNKDAFDLFHYILHKRMLQGVFTIADSTALKAFARQRILKAAQSHDYYTCLLIFNLPAALCIEQDQQRPRQVGPQVVLYHERLLPQAIKDSATEGWHQRYILNEQPTKILLEIVPDA
jgi:predicted kinase